MSSNNDEVNSDGDNDDAKNQGDKEKREQNNH